MPRKEPTRRRRADDPPRKRQREVEHEVEMATESAAEAGPSSSTNGAAGDDSYQVERILSMKTVGGVRHFLVKWVGGSTFSK